MKDEIVDLAKSLSLMMTLSDMIQLKESLQIEIEKKLAELPQNIDSGKSSYPSYDWITTTN